MNTEYIADAITRSLDLDEDGHFMEVITVDGRELHVNLDVVINPDGRDVTIREVWWVDSMEDPCDIADLEHELSVNECMDDEVYDRKKEDSVA